jgi:uncharacterized protein
MGHAELLEVSVAWGAAGGQQVVALQVPPGTTAAQAVAIAGPGLTPAALGIWGEVVTPGRLLADGDRVELYQALHADPKDQRRQRALRRR